MALPAPGPALSLNDIQTEFGGSNPIGLSEYYRGGSYVSDMPTTAPIPASGAIAIGNFYGTANRVAIPLTISASTNNYDVYTNRGPTYSPGISDLTVTINPGVVIGSSSVPSYAMLVPSSFNPADTIAIINNGLILGCGGDGGTGGSRNPVSGSAGSPGGHALYVNRPTTITNNGTISGGGGGGGGGASRTYTAPIPKAVTAKGGSGGSGGAGGGAAGSGGNVDSANTPSPGPAGNAGDNSGGGISAPGTPHPSRPTQIGGSGGAGGGFGASGSSGGAGSGDSSDQGPYAGAGGGNYIVGNAYVTWAVAGTLYGGSS